MHLSTTPRGHQRRDDDKRRTDTHSRYLQYRHGPRGGPAVPDRRMCNYSCTDATDANTVASTYHTTNNTDTNTYVVTNATVNNATAPTPLVLAPTPAPTTSPSPTDAQHLRQRR